MYDVPLGGFLTVVGGESSESVSLSCEASLFGLGRSNWAGAGVDLAATNGSSSSVRESFTVLTGVLAGDSPTDHKKKGN